VPAPAEPSAGEHKLAVATIVDRLWTLRRHSHVGLDYLPYEQAVALNHSVLVQPALEVGVAFRDQRCFHFRRGARGEPELRKLVDLVAVTVADAHDSIDEIDGGEIDDARPAAAQHLVAVVLVPDVAAKQRGRKAEHHVPSHGHDVGSSVPR